MKLVNSINKLGQLPYQLIEEIAPGRRRASASSPSRREQRNWEDEDLAR
jgi:hypothetical protein